MARIESLVGMIQDAALRKEIENAVIDLKHRRRFGLVFEEHIPETTTLLRYPLRIGSLVQRRDDLTSKVLYRVQEIQCGEATLVANDDPGHVEVCRTDELLAVKRLGDPMYPGLTSLARIDRGEQRPYHAVINGENYHALQLLGYLFEGQADVIYLDPPFNTGARDWKYNNRYVDDGDQWRHSKWLSFMNRRLRLARRLLKPDGVLIVAIDEHEVLHLGMLLEHLFPDYLRYMVTMVTNPKGVYKLNFARRGAGVLLRTCAWA